MITVSNEIKEKLPAIAVGSIQTRIKNTCEDKGLWNEIDTLILQLQKKYKRDDISRFPEVREARKLYRELGYDPARYRVSSEALFRRILSGHSLYKVNTCVDIANYMSLKHQLSLCIYNQDKIQGEIVLSCGEEGEVMDAIGGIMMNMASLPVYRDETGIIGSTTRDSQRTSVNPDTENILLIITSFSPETALKDVIYSTVKKYVQYTNAKIFDTAVYGRSESNL